MPYKGLLINDDANGAAVGPFGLDCDVFTVASALALHPQGCHGGLDLVFGIIAELIAFTGKELDPVVLWGIVGSGDHDPPHGAGDASQVGHSPCGAEAEGHHINTSGTDPCRGCALKHCA